MTRGSRRNGTGRITRHIVLAERRLGSPLFVGGPWIVLAESPEPRS